MKKLLDMTLAAAIAITSFAPAFAANAFHATIEPTTCVDCPTGTASARFLNNHFHLVLDLKAAGCPEFGSAFAGGLITRSTLHPIETVSFDYKTNFCNPPAATVFFLQAKGSDGHFYTFNCADFPTGGTGSFFHESFDRDSFNIPSGVNINKIWIGIVNSTVEGQSTATVENITVNDTHDSHGDELIVVVHPQVYCPSESD